MSPRPLGEFERMVLLAVLRLEDDAFGARIGPELEQATGRSISRGAVYKTLDRLERKGLATWSVVESTPRRRRLPRRRFEVTDDGIEALRGAQRTFEALTRGFEELLGQGRSGSHDP